MLRSALFLFVACVTVATSSIAGAQTRPPRPEMYVAADPIGLAGFLRLNIGSYEVSFEGIVARHHGLRVAGDFIHVHQDAAHVSSHQWTFGGSLGYRYYFGPGVGPFAGALVGYRRGFGHYGRHGQPDHVRLESEQLRVMAQVGYRFWAPVLHLSVVPKVALGYGPYSVWAVDRSDPEAEQIAAFSRDVLAPWAITFEVGLELAFGF